MSQAEVTKNHVIIPDPFNPKAGDMMLSPQSKPNLHIHPGCAKSNGGKATVCASSLRTANSQAECGTPDE